jgi:hypothetical protein
MVFTFLFFMQKVSGNSWGKNNKSCRIFHNESKKIGFAFFWLFYDFLEILQDSAKGQTLFKNKLSQGSLELSRIHRYVPGSRNTPWKDLISCNVTPGGGGRRGSLESGESGGTIGRGRGLRGGGAHQGSVLAVVGAGKAAGEVTRRRRAAPVTRTSAPAREVARVGHTQYGELE